MPHSEGHFEELGFYTLAGAPASTRDLIAEVRSAEELGLGHCFISERFNVKEAATVSGAVGAVSERIAIATAATNHHTRHPTITAAYASTMHSLTGGRFTLGIGRGVDRLWDAMGLPHITTAQMEDFAGLMRRLWAGEVILGHDGPAGSWPYLNLDGIEGLDIPLGLVAFGPNSLQLGGRAFDQIVLHTFFTDETTARVVKTVKDAAEQAGRDPDAVKVWSCFATVGDHIAPDLALKKTVGRLATYLQGYGDLLVRTNNWDPAVLERFRADEFVVDVPGRDRPGRHHRPARARGHADPRRVAGADGEGHARPVRRRGAQPVRPRLRRRDHARGHADRAGARGQGLRRERLSGSSAWPDMARLVVSNIASLDLYVNDAHGGFEWAAPDPEVHVFVNALERPIGTYLYGRRLYETMQVWDTIEPAPDEPEMADYASLWRAADKVVYSSSLPQVTTARTRLERSFDPDVVRALVRGAEADVSIGGPTLAAHAFAAGLVDDVHLFLNPVIVGGGTRALPDDVFLRLELVDERRFANGVVFLRYRVQS